LVLANVFLKKDLLANMSKSTAYKALINK